MSTTRVRNLPLLVLLPLLAVAGGCQPAATPAPGPGTSVPPPASRPAGAPPVVTVNGVPRTDADLCAAIQGSKTGDVITVRGDRGWPLDMSQKKSSAPTGRCYLSSHVDNVTVKGEGDPLIIGQLSLSEADGWLFDGLAMTPAPTGDRSPLVLMVGGDGWRWTNCELYSSGSMAEMNIGHWTDDIPRNFRLDHCFIHDNQGDPANDDNQNVNLYVFTADDVNANGLIEDNVFLGAPRGRNVKIGGTTFRPGEGSDGITLRNNVLVNNHPKGMNLLLATDADDVMVANNVFVVQGTNKPNNVILGGFTGSNVVLQDNLFWGYQIEGVPSPRPIMYSFNTTYEHIDLNEQHRIGQARNLRYDPGYPMLASFNPDARRFPPVSLGGVYYGNRGTAG